MENKVEKQAKEIFVRFCNYLNKVNWKFDTDTTNGNLIILMSARGDDLPMNLIIQVDSDKQLISLFSNMPFNMDKGKLLEGAVATSIINHLLADGSFDYDVHDGSILFRMTTSWRGGLISDEVFEYMMIVACRTIDKYNDKLLMVSKGAMSIDDLYKFTQQQG